MADIRYEGPLPRNKINIYTLTLNLSDFIYHDDTFTLHTQNESMALKYNLDNADCRQHYRTSHFYDLQFGAQSQHAK